MDKELGRSGLNRWGGYISEEFLTDLRGDRGIKIYREMSENDSTIGAILYAIKMLVRQADWRVEAGGKNQRDKDAAAFVQSCLDDLNIPWQDTISEILSFLTYGWSLHEIVYKRRLGNKKDPRLKSRFDDGLIGWAKLPIRAQSSLAHWEFDEHDNLIAFVQRPPPDYREIKIPAEKFLLFRTETHKDNPEGRSVLRTAYRDWFFKKRIQELEGIGIERDLAGLPVLIAPEGLDIWSDANLLKTCNDFVQNIRRDALEGLVLPFGWELKLLSASNGGRQFDTNAIIQRYDSRIAMTVLADFLFLGHEQSGSWALSSDKTRLFAVAIGTYLDIIGEVFNQKAIPALIEINGLDAAYPKLVHGDIETVDLDKLGGFLKTCAELGLINADDTLEDYLRAQAGLPARLEKDDY